MSCYLTPYGRRVKVLASEIFEKVILVHSYAGSLYNKDNHKSNLSLQ